MAAPCPAHSLRDRAEFLDDHGLIHASLDGITPDSKTGAPSPPPPDLARFRWNSHCRGLYQLPAAV
jgi:hypothetical protein